MLQLPLSLFRRNRVWVFLTFPLFLPIGCFAQSEYQNFIQVETEKIEAGDFDVPDSLYEKEDGAIYLYNIGKSTLDYDQRGKAELVVTRKFRLKILNKKGLEHADRAITLYAYEKSEQTIAGVKGKVYNRTGGRIESLRLRKEDWQIDDYSDDLKLARISFPNVKVGSIIELEYRVYDPNVFQMDDWDFQLDEPVVYSQYQVSYPARFGYKMLKVGYHPLHGSENYTKRIMDGTGVAANLDYDQVNYLFSAVNIPALRREPYTDSMENYRSAIIAELHYFDKASTGQRKFFYEDWKESAKEYSERRENKMFLESKGLDDSFSPSETGLEGLSMVRDIYHQVKAAVRHNGERGNLIMKRAPQNVVRIGSGSANEINMLLVSALRKNAIEAYPLLYSKRNRKRVLQQFPLFSQFSSILAVVMVDSGYVLLDASDGALTVGEIGESSYNGEGLSVNPKDPAWFPLKSKIPTKQKCSVELTELTENSVKGELRINLSGVYAYRVKKLLGDPDGPELEDYFKTAEGVELTLHEDGLLDLNDELKLSFDVEIPLETFGGSYIFPAVAVEPIAVNPFDTKERKYPVVFSDVWAESYTCLLRLDAEKYDVIPPETINLILPNKEAEMAFTASYNYGSLVVRSSVNVNSDYFEPRKYPRLRTFYDSVVAAQTSYIEIKKM